MENSKAERAPLRIRKDRTDKPVKAASTKKDFVHPKGYSAKVFRYKVEYCAATEAEAEWKLVKEVDEIDQATAVINSRKKLIQSKPLLFRYRIWDTAKNETVFTE